MYSSRRLHQKNITPFFAGVFSKKVDVVKIIYRVNLMAKSALG